MRDLRCTVVLQTAEDPSKVKVSDNRRCYIEIYISLERRLWAQLVTIIADQFSLKMVAQFSAQQALQMLQNIADDESGDDNSDEDIDLDGSIEDVELADRAFQAMIAAVLTATLRLQSP